MNQNLDLYGVLSFALTKKTVFVFDFLGVLGVLVANFKVLVFSPPLLLSVSPLKSFPFFSQ